MTSDRSFDDISQRFRKNIYETNKGALRLEIVWSNLQEKIPELNAREKLNILDIGAGMGQMALRLAEHGHELILCDVSQEMLNLAKEMFSRTLSDAAVSFIRALVQELKFTPHRQFDLVLCHAVLEWLAQPKQTLHQVLNFVKPGACLSLLFYNRHSIVFRNLIRGNFKKVESNELSGHPGGLTPINPLDPETVCSWLDEFGMQRISASGVRVFHDYMQRDLSKQRAFVYLLKLEKRFSRLDPYRFLGRYIHVIVRGPE